MYTEHLLAYLRRSKLRRNKRTEKVEHAARVAPLVVIPGNELNKVLVERDTGLRIEDGRVWVTIQIGRNNVVLSVGQNACFPISNNSEFSRYS